MTDLELAKSAFEAEKALQKIINLADRNSAMAVVMDFRKRFNPEYVVYLLEKQSFETQPEPTKDLVGLMNQKDTYREQAFKIVCEKDPYPCGPDETCSRDSWHREHDQEIETLAAELSMKANQPQASVDAVYGYEAGYKDGLEARHEQGVHERAPKFDFFIDDPESETPVLIWPDNGCRPASKQEAAMWKYIHGVNMNTQIVPDCSSTVERPAHNRRGCGFESRQSDQTQPTTTDKAVALCKQILCEIDTGADYLVARKAVAELSGKPVMALTFDEHIDVIRAALTSAPSVANGWRLVPEEPTEKMLDKGWCNAKAGNSSEYGVSFDLEQAYKAMLATAPQPPVCAENEHTEEMFQETQTEPHCQKATQKSHIEGLEEALENANRFRDGILEVRESVVEAARRQLARQKAGL